jgi:hypothetical protein
MALTAGITPNRRGAPPTSGIFGGPVAAGEKIWRGGMLGFTITGALQRIQTAGCVSFAGMASKDYDNTAGSAAASVGMEALKGTFALTVPGATYANLYDPVYATDDGTFTLADAKATVYTRGATDTGNGTVAGMSASSAAKDGVYTVTILAGAATFSVTDPTGAALPNGTLGSAYSQSGLSFTLSNGGVNFVAGDTATIAVDDATGGMQVGTLAGIENGQTYVKLLGG